MCSSTKPRRRLARCGGSSTPRTSRPRAHSLCYRARRSSVFCIWGNETPAFPIQSPQRTLERFRAPEATGGWASPIYPTQRPPPRLCGDLNARLSSPTAGRVGRKGGNHPLEDCLRITCKPRCRANNRRQRFRLGELCRAGGHRAHNRVDRLGCSGSAQDSGS